MSLAAFLNLRGERALIVGGGQVALRRAQTLLQAGMMVQVIAPSTLPEFGELDISLSQRAYQAGDALGKRIVVAAADQHAVNDAVTAEALANGALVNHAGDAKQGNLRFPAVTEQAGIQVAVSSGRELPMLAQELSRIFALLLPGEAQLQRWASAREQALTLTGEQRKAALEVLRRDIRQALAGTA